MDNYCHQNIPMSALKPEKTNQAAQAIPSSAEAKALQRLQDIDDSTKWVSVVEEGQEINIEPGLERLKQRGYKIQIPSSNTPSGPD